ncbi:MAG: LolA family protein [Phycisphaerae bacterium]
MKRMRIRLLTMLLAAAGILQLGALGASANDPNTPTTQPSDANAAKPKLDPAVAKILDGMESAGTYRTIRANIVYQVYDRLEGTREIRKGTVYHAKGDPNDPNATDRFAVHFNTLQRNKGPAIRERIRYAFDGKWFTIAKERVKQIHRIQVARGGQRVEPMRLGRGPFPLPFGQKTEDMVRFFELDTRDPKSSDPNGTSYIELVTKPRYRRHVNFLKLEMWIDRRTNRPVKIVSHQGDPTKKKHWARRRELSRRDIIKRTTVTFDDVKTNVEIDKDLFRPEKKRGWKLIVKPLDKAQPDDLRAP